MEVDEDTVVVVDGIDFAMEAVWNVVVVVELDWVVVEKTLEGILEVLLDMRLVEV